MQNMYLDQPRRDLLGWPAIWRFDDVVAECAALLAAARTGGLPVIYTRQIARADGADAMPAYRRLQEEAGSTAIADDGSWTQQILDAVAAQPGDIVIEKLRWDAFFGTELDQVLHNIGATRLVVAGLQTNVCVETTARTALMKNFEVAVPEDAVSTDGKALHFAGLDAMRVLYAEVAPWRELLDPGATWERRFRTAHYGREPEDYELG